MSEMCYDPWNVDIDLDHTSHRAIVARALTPKKMRGRV